MSKAKTRYAVVIDGKPGAFGLWVPDMPGCTSMGETVDDVLQKAQEALRMWAEDAAADGEPLPAPRSFAEIRKGCRRCGGVEGRRGLGHRAIVDRKRALREGEPVAGCLAACGYR